MPSTLDTTVETGFFGLFKGDSGSGKTVASLSFPNPYVFDFDRKMPAISLKHFPGKEVYWDTFENIFDIGDKVGGLMEDCPYETIIADSVTSLSYNCIKSIDDVKGQNVLTMLKNFKKSSKGYSTIELRGYDYYNGEDNFLKFFIDQLKLLWARPGNPKHVIIVAHVLTAETTDIKTKVVTKTRRIVTAGKNIAAYIPAQFDECWHFGVERPPIDDPSVRVQHVVCTEAIGDDYAKTAYNLDPIIDFTKALLYEKIEAALSHQAPTPQPEKPKAAKRSFLD